MFRDNGSVADAQDSATAPAHAPRRPTPRKRYVDLGKLRRLIALRRDHGIPIDEHDARHLSALAAILVADGNPDVDDLLHRSARVGLSATTNEALHALARARHYRRRGRISHKGLGSCWS